MERYQTNTRLVLDILTILDSYLTELVKPGAIVSEDTRTEINSIWDFFKERLYVPGLLRERREIIDRIRHNLRIVNALYGPQSA